jgi:hypothetical protein
MFPPVWLGFLLPRLPHLLLTRLEALRMRSGRFTRAGWRWDMPRRAPPRSGRHNLVNILAGPLTGFCSDVSVVAWVVDHDPGHPHLRRDHARLARVNANCRLWYPPVPDIALAR